MTAGTLLADVPALAPYRHVLGDCGVRTLGELVARIDADERLAWSFSDLRGVPGIGRDDERFIRSYVRDYRFGADAEEEDS